MKQRKMLALMLVLTTLAAVLCGCAPQNNAPPTTNGAATPSTAQPTASSEEDKYGGVATFVINADPKNINYFASNGGNIDIQSAILTNDYLALYNPTTGKYEGRLLESFEMSEDGKVWTMKLRDNIFWHDGTQLTTEDVVFTYEYLRDPTLDVMESQDAPLIEETFEIVDKLTYKVITEEPNPSELSDWQGVLPKHIWKDVPPSNFSKAEQGRLMVGCGPFKMTEYKVGEYVRYDRFDDYYGGKPYLDTIYYRIIPDAAAASAALESAQVDCITVDATVAGQMQGKSGISLWQGSSGNVNRLYFNLTNEKFTDVRVRQAVAHLMQRDIYVQQAMRGFADPAYSDFAPTDFYYKEDAYKKYDFSIEKANTLLDEAGFVKGSDGVRAKGDVRLEIEVLYTSTAPQASAALLIMTPVFAEAGIKIIPKLPDDATMNSLWDTHEYEMLNSGTTMGPDPYRYQYIFGSPAANNIMLYENEEMINRFATAAATLDTAKSEEIYREVQDVLSDEVVNIPLWYRHTIYAYNSKLVVDEATPVGYVHFRFLHMEKLYMMK